MLTRKLGMTSIIDENGAVVAVTLLSANPNTVTQVKSDKKDGYNAVQLGYEEVNKTNKPLMGHLKPTNKIFNIMREFKIENSDEEIKIGDEIKADLFSIGDSVDVTGVSKGKGFAGTIKRHNFHRGPKTHGGQSYRRPGSIGSMYPQRIFPGKKMAGHLGHQKTTVKHLKVAYVDAEKGLIGVTGAVPGPQKALILLRGNK